MQHRRRVTLLGIVLFSASAWFSTAQAEPTIKIGVNHQMASGAGYALEDDPGATMKATNSDQLVGNEIFFEWLVMGRVGLEIATSATPLSRNYELKSGSTVISRVQETATLTTYGANLYFNRNTTRGFQYLFGVGGGTLKIDHEFTGGTLGDASSSLTLPVTHLKFGVDWLLPAGGLRAQFASFTASDTDTEQVTGYKQTLTYNLQIISLGVFVFFQYCDR